MDAKTLSDEGYTLFNVDDTKKPVHQGFGIVDWIKMPHNELKKRIDFSKEMFGMRLGKQGNGKYILSLDFDCCKKVNGSYVTCDETVALLEKYNVCVEGCGDGMFESSTEGNYNVLIDYTNTILLKDMILKENKNKIVRSGVGLELLLGGNQIIPPSITKCKMTDTFNKRRSFMTDIPFKVIDDNDPICKFIVDYIKSTTQTIPTEKKRKYNKIEEDTNETNETNETKEKNTELLDIISIQCWDDFNIWKKLVWAMKKEGYTKEIARKYSMLSASFDEGGFNNVWDKSPSSITLTQGTINHYAKESNESKY